MLPAEQSTGGIWTLKPTQSQPTERTAWPPDATANACKPAIACAPARATARHAAGARADRSPNGFNGPTGRGVSRGSRRRSGADAHKRATPRPIRGGSSHPRGAETREIPRETPLSARIWRDGGDGRRGAPPPRGRVLPMTPPRAGGRKESPHVAELVSGGGPFFRAISTEKERHANHHDEHRGHPPV